MNLSNLEAALPVAAAVPVNGDTQGITITDLNHIVMTLRAQNAAAASKKPNRCVRFFGGAVIGGAVGAAGCALAGLIGAEILKAADLPYQSTPVVNAAAAGGALLFSVYTGCLLALRPSIEETGASKNQNKIGEMVVAAGFAALSGVLGALMLNQEDDMTLGQYAAASALGSTVSSLGFAAIGAMCGQ